LNRIPSVYHHQVMRLRTLPFIAVLVLGLPIASAAQPCTETLAQLFERVSPAVVSIQAMKINKIKPQRRFETIVGSGLIIDRGGEIPTNADTADRAPEL